MHATAEEINAALAGFTDVVKLSFISTQIMGTYDLRLVLADDDDARLVLQCSDVSNLRISAFGGGLTQLLALRCRDVRALQHDRVTLHFSDYERESFDFDCFRAEVLS